MLRAVLVFFVLFKTSTAVIYKLNATEYARMPPLYALDDYHNCIVETDGTFCVVDVDLFSKTDNPLLNLIHEFSADTKKHFNHTQIHRGVCVTKTCKYYIENRNLQNDGDLKAILGACLNNSLYNEYQIQGKVAHIEYCKRKDEPVNLDIYDVIVAVVYIVLIALNVIGSFYDGLLVGDDCKKGNRYLLAFSVKRNWKKLVASSEGPDPRLNSLKIFHGFRAITMICVFFSHTTLIMAYSYVANPEYIEKAYEDPFKQILFNGSLVTHTFFMMSSFLLSYNFMIFVEKHSISWFQFPFGVLQRWLRLTPVYALVLATLSTWMRYLGEGPLWDKVVVSESLACRQYWWAHILYINNYVYDDNFCAPQTWYLAADTQLFVLGLFVCVFARTMRAKKIVLSLLFVISLIVPAAHTYFQNLDAVVIQSPEVYRNLYKTDNTFRLLYVRGHTNLSTYVIGLAAGFLAYTIQKNNVQFNKKLWRWPFWAMFPAGVGVILTGGLFYADGDEPSDLLRVTYATFYKPVFQLLIVSLIFGFILKIDTAYRAVCEWRGWTWCGRASYAGFLLHTIFQRGLVGSMTAPVRMSDYFVFYILAGTICLAFICGGLLFIFVESPLAVFFKVLLEGGNRKKRSEESNTKM